jgi:hypothetical protein
MKTIDPNGELPLSNVTLKFSSYVDFVDQVAKLPETYQCLAEQYDAYATGRAAAEIPKCERDPVGQAFAITSPNFALRRN